MKTTKLFYVLLVSGIVCLYSCTPKTDMAHDGRHAMEEKNKAAMMKVQDAFATGSTNIDEYVAENMVEHTPDPNIKTQGREGLKEMITMVHTAYPDGKMEVIKMVADSDYVIAHFRMTGMNSGPWGTMPATNKSMDVNGVDIVRFENGKGVEHWGYFEEMKMMTQLGLMPPMDATQMAPDTTKKM
jgi:predicted ester cyclase